MILISKTQTLQVFSSAWNSFHSANTIFKVPIILKELSGDLQVGDGEGESSEGMRSFGRRRLRGRKQKKLLDEGTEVFTNSLLQLLCN